MKFNSLQFGLLSACMVLQFSCGEKEFTGSSSEQKRNSDSRPEPTKEPGDRVFGQASDLDIETGTPSGTIGSVGGTDDLSDVPGDQVEKVGVHFEDSSDFDWNDLSTCFAGNFRVSGRSIVSTKSQSVQFAIKRLSGASYSFDIQVQDANGAIKDRYQGSIGDKQLLQRNFQFEPRYKVYVKVVANGSFVLDINHGSRAEVVKDVCKNTGI